MGHMVNEASLFQKYGDGTDGENPEERQQCENGHPVDFAGALQNIFIHKVLIMSKKNGLVTDSVGRRLDVRPQALQIGHQCHYLFSF